MNILVTGAAGFLGHNICSRLLKENHTVIGVDNFITGTPQHINFLRSFPGFTFIEQDISSTLSISDKLDAVLNFASPASPSADSPYGYVNLPIQTMTAGSHGTYNTIELARKNDARFLLASTSEVYGDPLEHPQNEDYWGNVDPIGIRSVYDEAKRFAEALTMAYYRTYQVNTGIVRIFNTYGPGMRIDDGRVIPNFIVQALTKNPLTIYGDGSQTRSFCFVDDLIEGIFRYLFSSIHFPLNIGNTEEITILKLAEIINLMTNNPAGVEFKENFRIGSDPERRRPDIFRAKNLLNWEPTINIENGLEKTIPYFIKQLKTR